MPKVLVVGGAYAGFHAARHREKRLRRSEARFTFVLGGGPRVHR